MNALLPLLCFLPMASALGCYITGRFSKPLRDTLVALTGIVVFALAVLTALQPALSFSIPGFCGLGLNLKADGFRSLYACVAAFMWMMTGLFS
ncbi:MAG: hypothetical protein ACI4MK_07755, partial [Aristaeellaceae bacterium]